MPRKYGFRVFRASIYENQKKNNPELPAHIGSEAMEGFMALVSEAASLGTQFLEPKQPEDPVEPRLPKVSITVGEPRAIGDGVFHIEVLTGEVGDHRHAVEEGGTTQPLDRHSAERRQYVTIMFPKNEDATTFLLAMETVSGSDVRERFFKLLWGISGSRKKAAQAKEELDRQVSRDLGLPLGPRKRHVRYLFDVGQVADSDYLSGLLQNAQSATADFTEQAPSASGGMGTQVQKRLTFSLLTDEQKQSAADVGRRWFRRKGRAEELSDHPDAIAELATALNLKTEEVNEYDDVAIRIKSKRGETVTVRPFDVRDFFTYQVSDGRPNLEQYYSRVTPKLSELAASLSLEVSDVDIQEG